jgi:ribosome biogenesis protein BRX1
MAAVYKSLNKGTTNGATRDADVEKPRNRQRVLMLSSRGVTMRYARKLESSEEK